MEVQKFVEYSIMKTEGPVILNETDHPLIMTYIRENDDVVAKSQEDLMKVPLVAIVDHFIPADEFKAMSTQIMGDSYDKDSINVLLPGNTIIALIITKLY